MKREEGVAGAYSTPYFTVEKKKKVPNVLSSRWGRGVTRKFSSERRPKIDCAPTTGFFVSEWKENGFLTTKKVQKPPGFLERNLEKTTHDFSSRYQSKKKGKRKLTRNLSQNIRVKCIVVVGNLLSILSLSAFYSCKDLGALQWKALSNKGIYTERGSNQGKGH